jgi:hypothetical protein
MLEYFLGKFRNGLGVPYVFDINLTNVLLVVGFDCLGPESLKVGLFVLGFYNNLSWFRLIIMHLNVRLLVNLSWNYLRRVLLLGDDVPKLVVIAEGIHVHQVGEIVS